MVACGTCYRLLHRPSGGRPPRLSPSGSSDWKMYQCVGAGAAVHMPQNALRRAGGGRHPVGRGGHRVHRRPGGTAVAVRAGQPVAASGAGECDVLADPGRQVPAGREHEGLRRAGERRSGGLPPRRLHDRGAGHRPAGRCRRDPRRRGDGGGEHLRRRGGAAAVSGHRRRAAGLFLQGGEHHGLHAGVCGAAL